MVANLAVNGAIADLAPEPTAFQYDTLRMSPLIRAATALALGLVVSPALAQEKLTNYQLVILRPGPAQASAGTPEGQKIIKEHVAHLYKLGADRQSMAAGPFTASGGNIAGILIMKAESPEKARELESADPGVKAGIFTVEVLPFMALDAGMRAWAEYPQFETVYFGFLDTGPNRTQDADTAKRLQAEHLAYMGDQHKQGKLIFAGPFVDAGTHRGLVVYRVGSMEEAKSRAEGDPMVKVGRLAVDLHAWQVPRGALPESLIPNP